MTAPSTELDELIRVELRQSQQRFMEMAELLPGVLCEVDLDLKLTYVNQTAIRIFGYTQQDFDQGFSITRLIHQEDLPRAMQNTARLLGGEAVTPQAYRLVHSDGTVRDYLTNSARIERDGRTVGIRTCLLDVTELRETQAQLRASEQRFRSVFEQSPIGIALFSSGGELLEHNDAFAGLFADAGQEEGGALSGSLASLAGAPAAVLGRVLAGEGVRCESLADQSRHLEWHLSRLGAADRAAAAVLAQVVDVTAHRLAERARLQASEQARERAEQQVRRLRQEMVETARYEDMVSRSQEMRQIFDALPQMADSAATVLISGESGTGKELVARALHRLSPRKAGPFVALNCSALPDNLLESELFGYCAGAFTDARKDKPGKFALAEGGTLFLDEIGDISAAMQVKLLRVLQERCYEPLGGTASIRADVRVIAASNRDLAELVRGGAFRDDLYYRIKVLHVKLPPLRQRRVDIPLLCQHFVELFNRRYEKEIRGLSREAMERLLGHDFPGNIRELENIVDHAFVFCRGDEIGLSHLPEDLSGQVRSELAQSLSKVGSFEELEAMYLKAVLEECQGNRLEAARRLGVHKSTLFRKLRRLGLQTD